MTELASNDFTRQKLDGRRVPVLGLLEPENADPSSFQGDEHRRLCMDVAFFAAKWIPKLQWCGGWQIYVRPVKAVDPAGMGMEYFRHSHVAGIKVAPVIAQEARGGDSEWATLHELCHLLFAEAATFAYQLVERFTDHEPAKDFLTDCLWFGIEEPSVWRLCDTLLAMNRGITPDAMPIDVDKDDDDDDGEGERSDE